MVSVFLVCTFWIIWWAVLIGFVDVFIVSYMYFSYYDSVKKDDITTSNKKIHVKIQLDYFGIILLLLAC